MDKVTRDVRLHYGGIFHQNCLFEGIELFEWIGGAFVDVKNACLEQQTLEGITKLFCLHCPVKECMNLRFYYMVGGSRFELDKDMKVEFAWSICPKATDDVMRNIYCVSDLVIPSLSISNTKTNSQSTTVSHSVSHIEEIVVLDEAPPIDLTQEEFNPNGNEVNSPIKKSKIVKRSTRLCNLNVGSPSANTRGASLRKTPMKRIVRKKAVKQKLQVDVNDDPLPKIPVPFGEPINVDDTVEEIGKQTNEDTLIVDFSAFSGIGPEENENEAGDATPIGPELSPNDYPGFDNLEDNEIEHHAYEPSFNFFENEEIGGEADDGENGNEAGNQEGVGIEGAAENVDGTTHVDLDGPFDSDDSDGSMFDDTESDTDYAPDEDKEEEEEELHPDDIAEQAEYLPEFKDFVDKTFDLTEQNPCLVKTVRFEDEIQLAVGQEWTTMKEARDHMRLYAIKKKFELKFKVNNVDKLICICRTSGCPWRCYIRRTNDGFTAICKSINEEHNCENDLDKYTYVFALFGLI